MVRGTIPPTAISMKAIAFVFACLVPLHGNAAEPLLNPVVDSSYSGRVRTEYDYRAQGDEADSDVYGYWYCSGRDLFNGSFDFYSSGRLHTDLDRPSSSSYADDMYLSLDDENGVTENRILQLYIECRNTDWRMRLGRQYVDVADYLPLDGFQLIRSEEGRLGGRIYVGSPFSQYTSVTADYAAGISFIARPWAGNSARITFSLYHDESESGNDRNYYLDLRQDITDAARTRAQLSVLNDEFRMAQLDFYFFPPDSATDLYFGGSRWGQFDAETRAYSPFYSVLGEQQPYTYVYARLTQNILPSLMLSPGAAARFIDGDEDSNNHSYDNYDLTLTFEPSRSYSSSLSAEYWDVKDGDKFIGLTGDIRYRYHKLWEISFGAGYVDYSYSRYSDISYSINGGQTVFSEEGTIIEESPYVYTYTLQTKWNITRKLSLKLQGDIENDSTEADKSYRGRASVEARL